MLPTHRPTLLGGLLLVSFAWLTGCGEPEPRPLPDAADLPLRGTRPVAPMGKVDFTMPDASGDPFDFRTETRGDITLLFFGYTYCPDICPVQMATLAAGLDELDPGVRDRIDVVFVTVDPERDTPERLGGWLSTFDSSFVGVRGTDDEIAAALDYYRYPPPERSADGEVYWVSHPAFVYAFTPDGFGRAMYGSETTPQIWAHDLALMAAYPWKAWGDSSEVAATATSTPAAASASPGSATTDSLAPLATIGGIRILDAYAPSPVDGERTALYLTLRNADSRADTLRGLSTPVAGRASLHRMTTTQGGMSTMTRMAGLAVGPGETVVLAPGERHGMLEEVSPDAMAPGDTIPVTLTFARAGQVTVPVRVVRYQDLGG